MENLDFLNRVIKGEITLQAFDVKTGKLKREVKGHNKITRRGLIEMILKYLGACHTSTSTGGWGALNNYSALASLALFNTADKLPINCGDILTDIRHRMILLNDSSPAESYDSIYNFTSKIYSHSLFNNRNPGSDFWNPSTMQLNLSWSYGATNWYGTVNSIIIGNSDTSPTHAAHRVVLPTPFVKQNTENAVLNWTWTIALPA